ncbi:MAG: endonuclease MutS2 [Bacteroidota bacterium]|nr:endonuclease MutS2 [Bacteroidota bacterium]
MKSRFTASAEKLDLPKILHRIQSYASSELGIEAAEQIEPCSDLNSISIEHNRVSELRRILESEEQFPIDGIKDIRSSVQHSKVENNILSAKELLNIGLTLQVARSIKSFIEKRKEYLIEISSLTSLISIQKEVEFNIFQSIDENGNIKDSASKELKNIRREIAQKQQIIRKALEKILRVTSEQGIVQDEIVTTRDGRLVIPIKAELRNKFPGFIHSTSSSGQTVFIEPSETLTLNNDICELIFLEKREIEKILKNLTTQIREAAIEISHILKILQQIDLCYAKARYSIEINGNKPLLKENGSIVIYLAYHPALLLRHTRESIVPLNISLGNAFATLLITGPNAGGKTVALKAVGILALMVQCGIHVPVSPDSEFPIFKEIFVSIGDNQSIENDLSTFSSQVLQLKEIVDNAADGDLVLIDEIGSNTDPTEGGALAASVLEYLTKSGALTIATSHQASLKAFAHNSEGMENAAMEFDQVSLLPTYRLKTGIPGSSYALEIAERLGMAESIILKCREMLGDQKNKLEQLILDLENRTQQLQSKLYETDEKLLKYKQLYTDYEGKLRAFNNDVREIKKKAILEAKALIEKASSQIERTVKEIKNHQASKDVIKSGKHQIAELEHELLKLETELGQISDTEPEHPLSIHIDDQVTLKSGGQFGVVLSPPDKNGNLLVAFNSIKAKINVSNISSAKKKENQSSGITIGNTITKDISAEVDVRGQFGDDAVSTVDKFLDDAVLSGLHLVDIIHGKGTGVLQKRIHSFLEHDARIKSYRFGELNEGGAGVTIVELS